MRFVGSPKTIPLFLASVVAVLLVEHAAITHVSAPSAEERVHRSRLGMEQAAGRTGYDIEYQQCYTTQLTATLAAAYDVPARRLHKPAKGLLPDKAWVDAQRWSNPAEARLWKLQLVPPAPPIPPSVYDHRLIPSWVTGWPAVARRRWAQLDPPAKSLAEAAGYDPQSWDLGRDPPALVSQGGTVASKRAAAAAAQSLHEQLPLPGWVRDGQAWADDRGSRARCGFNWLLPPSSAIAIGRRAEAAQSGNGLAAGPGPAGLLRQLHAELVEAGAGAEAMAALRGLAVESADAAAAAAAAEVYLSVGRLMDPAHDRFWSYYCGPSTVITAYHRAAAAALTYAADPTGPVPAGPLVGALPWSSQGCWYADATDFGNAAGTVAHYIFKYVNIGLCLGLMIITLVYRGAFNGEYVLIHRTIAAFAAIRIARTAAFLATSLPVINLSCRARFTGVSNGGGCGDYLFSGHGSIIVVSLCLFWTQRADHAPRWPLLALAPLSALLVLVLAGYALERWHYSVDVVLGLACPAGVWVAIGPVFGREVVWRRQGLRKVRYLYLPERLATGPLGLRSGAVGPLPVWLLVLPIVAMAVAVGLYAKAFAAPISAAAHDATFGALEGAAMGIMLVCTTCDEEVEEELAPAPAGSVAAAEAVGGADAAAGVPEVEPG